MLRSALTQQGQCTLDRADPAACAASQLAYLRTLAMLACQKRFLMTYNVTAKPNTRAVPTVAAIEAKIASTVAEIKQIDKDHLALRNKTRGEGLCVHQLD